MIDITDIEAVIYSAKAYLAERKRFEKIQARGGGDYQNMTQKQNEKRAADLGWAAVELLKIEARLHTDCVNAGLADARQLAHYAPRDHHASSWHKYKFTPPLPRCLEGVT